jgi:hypothetical protein
VAEGPLDTDADVTRIAATLNAIGLEVEGIEDPAEKLKGFAWQDPHRRSAPQCRQVAGA